jgi:hypothetical protein
VDDLLELPVGRLGHLKQQVSTLFHRANTSDLATGVQMAATSGGGRVATVAAVLGLCLSSAGVATVCVVTGVVTDPLGLLRDDRPRVVAKPRVTKPHATHRTPSHTFARAAATPAPTPAATPAPRPRPTARRWHVAAATPTPAATDPSQGTTPTSHENAPISPAPASATGQESFAPEVAQTPITPAPAPATGGEEFGP